MAEYDMKTFTNMDSEPFIGMWGGEEYLIAPNEARQFPVFLVDHFAKHLADKILNREDDTLNELRRKALEGSFKSGAVVEAKKEEEKTEGQKVKEEVEKAQVEISETEKKRKEEIHQKRIEALKKARAAKAKKKLVKKSKKK